ncbi:MAG: phosphoglycerate kinase [Thermoproteota archaeon]|jgi:phosphoglycerate kinase|nr:phosphoglycerate kinase [Thermoproteota archaeon]
MPYGILRGKVREDILEQMNKIDVGFKTMDDFEFENKVVLLRTDMNLPLDPKTNMPIDLTRMRVLAETTLTELLVRGARVAILTHQGRPGDPDFTTTDLHAKLLSKMLKTKVIYVPDVYGPKAVDALKKLREGEYRIVMLENVRTDPDEMIKRPFEEQAKTKQVQTLSVLCDIYVNDAFAAAHRANVSLTGYPFVMPSCAGRVMEWEVRALTWLLQYSEKPRLYILGGTKLDDAISMIEHLGETGKADWIFLAGLIGNLYLKVVGYNLGEVNEKLLERKGAVLLYEGAKIAYEKYKDKIILPQDLAAETPKNERFEFPLSALPLNMPIKDIGMKTCELIEDILNEAKTVIISGPVGVYEESLFSYGTKRVLKAIASSNAFSVAGGGHTVAALNMFGYAEKFSHVSTGGGALTEMLMEKELPGIAALRQARF